MFFVQKRRKYLKVEGDQFTLMSFIILFYKKSFRDQVTLMFKRKSNIQIALITIETIVYQNFIVKIIFFLYKSLH